MRPLAEIHTTPAPPVCNLVRLRELFDRGLTGGLGDEHGQVCIEAAVALACGYGLMDAPPCVHPADRDWAVTINDAPWSSSAARADALWPIALAQIGTADRVRAEWVKAVVLGTVRRVVPIVLRALDLETHALVCENAADLQAAARAASNATQGCFLAEGTYLSIARDVSRATSGAARAAYLVSNISGLDAHLCCKEAARDAARATAWAARAARGVQFVDIDMGRGAGLLSADTVLREACAVAVEAYSILTATEPR